MRDKIKNLFQYREHKKLLTECTNLLKTETDVNTIQFLNYMLGLSCVEIGDVKRARLYAEKSLIFSRSSFQLKLSYWLVGLCCDYLQDKDSATENYTMALSYCLDAEDGHAEKIASNLLMLNEDKDGLNWLIEECRNTNSQLTEEISLKLINIAV